jgi:hypothetical protein
MLRIADVHLVTIEDKLKPEAERVRVALRQEGKYTDTGIVASTHREAIEALASRLTALVTE